MTEKYISLLRHQIDKLNDEDFDLEAWKSSTIVVLGRIFGEASEKINQIQKIKFEFGSWSLRDASGHSDQMESCKRRGKAILEACISELEIVGLEEQNVEIEGDSPITVAMEEELKMSQFRELKSILNTKASKDEKISHIVTKLMNYGSEVGPRIVAQIMTNPKNKKLF